MVSTYNRISASRDRKGREVGHPDDAHGKVNALDEFTELMEQVEETPGMKLTN